METHLSLSRDWRDEANYAALFLAEPAALAWEWLRRDPAYRAAARKATERTLDASIAILSPCPDAARWGLHAFEDPALDAAAARPMWRRTWLPRVLGAIADDRGPPADRFDIRRFADLATLVSGQDGVQHLLLSDGRASVRLDVAGESLLKGPMRLHYRLAGLAGARDPLATLQALLRLWQSGRLDWPRGRDRNRRLILLLRTDDALRDGASQRDIAEALLNADAGQVRWRSEVPSLRLRAQRLVKGARAMAQGAFRTLLGS